MKNLSFIFALLLGTCVSVAQPLKNFITAKPEEVGMSSERLTRVDKAVEGYVNAQKVPGAIAFIARNGKIVLHKAYGSYDSKNHAPLKKDDIFRIASQTKAITSVAIMMLLEEGKFLLDEPVSKYIPEFAKPTVITAFNEKDSSYTSEPAKSEITIRHLLTHTSGIDYASIGSKEFKAIYAKAKIPSGIGSRGPILAEKMKILGKLPLKHNPGEKFSYGLNTDVLGYLVEVCSGMTLEEFFKKRIFEPLGMNDTYFALPKEKQNRLVDLYSDQSGKLTAIPGIVIGPEMSDYPTVPSTYFSGGAGLSSTIEDYAKFLQMLLNGGTYNGTRLLSRKTIELMTTNQLTDKVSETMQFGLGFEVETAKTDYLRLYTIGSYWWGGAFSTSYWVDPKEKIVALFYMQMIPNSQSELANKFRSLTYQAIID
jgi:CubicO group peptidase (beta-lactamase class C family)